MDWKDSDALERVEDHAASTIDGEVVVLQFEEGTYYSMKGVAARIWDHLSEAQTFGDLHSKLMEEFEVEADTLRRDIASFLDDLMAHDLVRLSGESA